MIGCQSTERGRERQLKLIPLCPQLYGILVNKNHEFLYINLEMGFCTVEICNLLADTGLGTFPFFFLNHYMITTCKAHFIKKPERFSQIYDGTLILKEPPALSLFPFSASCCPCEYWHLVIVIAFRIERGPGLYK